MQTIKKTTKKDNINYKKLFFELMIVLFVVFVVVLVILYPILKEHGAFDNHSYDQYRNGILAKADDFDGSNGRDIEFEKELDEGWAKSTSGSIRQFYYGLASAVYYCKIGYIYSSEERFDVLYNMIPNDKSVRMDLESRDVICQRSRNV